MVFRFIRKKLIILTAARSIKGIVVDVDDLTSGLTADGVMLREGMHPRTGTVTVPFPLTDVTEVEDDSGMH